MLRDRFLPIARLLAGARAPNPMLTVGVVFAGAFLTTLQGRLFSMSLPDLRGAFGLDVIEGAWLSAVMSSAQLLTMPITVALSLIFGPARVLIVASVTIALATVAIPFASSYELLIALHFIVGLCLGAYLPLTISLALRNLKPQYWLVAMAIYSLRASFGTDLGVGLSGFFVDTVDWRWVYWSTSIAGPVIAFMAWKALSMSAIDREQLRRSDWGGMAMFCLSLALLLAGFSLGETLGWFDSGVVAGCLCAGALLFALAIGNIVLNKRAFVNLTALGNHNVRTALLIACLYAILMAPTAVLIPNFLIQIGALKPLQTGTAAFATFGAYLLLTPLAVWLARRIDARLLLIAGLSLIVLGCAYCGSSISYEWRADQYFPVLLLFAAGECLTLMGLIPIIVVNMNPQHAAAIGVYAPLARVLAPGIAGGLIATVLRLASDTHSAMLRSGVEAGQPIVVQRAANGISSIGTVIAREAAVLAYIDTFHMVLGVGVIALLLAATLKAAPANPITPPRTA